MDVSFLTWNLKRQSNEKILSALGEIYTEHKPDFLLLGETGVEDKKIEALANGNLKSVMLSPDKSIRLYVNPIFNVNMVNEEDVKDGRYGHINERIVFFQCEIEKVKFVLVGVHFPSKLSHPPNTQYNIMKRWLGWIRGQEKICETNNSIIFGDLNLNPFDIAIYRDGGLNAHPTIDHSGRVKPLYYNPMWSTLGDFIYKSGEEKVPGTYFYNLPIDNADDFHWNAIDAVLIKKSLVKHFSKKDLEIITGTTSHKFYESHKIDATNYSDHLPLKFKLNT